MLPPGDCLSMSNLTDKLFAAGGGRTPLLRGAATPNIAPGGLSLNR